MNYQQFINRKAIIDSPSGFDPDIRINPKLFEFQKDITRWALRRGRACLFEDCGLGKTPQQLEWAHHVSEKTGRRVLILTPLAVSRQTEREAVKFGIDAKVATGSDDISSAITITNYEKLHRFDPSEFVGIVLDESSILKSFEGSTRTAIIDAFKRTPYKLACTATPAPNDYMELGNHAEFVGAMSRTEMLSMFFTHDGGDTSKWRLKGHAESAFWKWLCSWAVNIRKPSDIGYDDDGFALPPLKLHEAVVSSTGSMDGYLFQLPASSLIERRDARRASLTDRVKMVADLANSDGSQWAVWCNLNSESVALAKAIDGAVEITGSDSDEHKENSLMGFIDGSIRCIVTKPTIAGFGINMQTCHNMAFCGLSDSYEQFYQAVRRCWRFGQTKEVNAHIITSDIEGAVVANIKRKEEDSIRMAMEMVRNMSSINSSEIHSQTKRSVTEYTPETSIKLPSWISTK